MIFDFERPPSQADSDTVGEILKSLARFVVADLAGPSVSFELVMLVLAFYDPFRADLAEGTEGVLDGAGFYPPLLLGAAAA